MSKKKKKKSILRSPYYWTLFILCVAFTFALNEGLKYGWGLLEKYEAAQPKYVADDAIALFEGRDFHAIYALDTQVSEVMDPENTEQDYIDLMNARTEGKAITTQETFSASDEEKNYTVTAGEDKFATFVLSKTDEVDELGNAKWALTSVTTLGWTRETYTVTAPSDYTVSFNGIPLDESCVTESGITTWAEGHLPEGVAAPTLTKYAKSTCFGAPTVTAVNAEGETLEPDAQEGNDSTFNIRFQDDELRPKLEDTVVEVAKTIALHTTGDVSDSALNRYIYDNSPAREVVENTDNAWVHSHSGCSFSSVATKDYYVYDENCFSCVVGFNFKVNFYEGKATYPTIYTLYFYKKGDTCKLYNFTID